MRDKFILRFVLTEAYYLLFCYAMQIYHAWYHTYILLIAFMNEAHR